MKKLLLLLAAFGLTSSPAHTLPLNGTVIGGVASAAIVADLLRGQNSFLRGKGVQLKNDLKLLISLATSKQTLREKLTTLRQIFGRNWGKMTLFFLFVVMPLVQKYRNDPTWLKNKTSPGDPLKQEGPGNRIFSTETEGSLGALPPGYAAMKAEEYYRLTKKERPADVDTWIAVKTANTRPEFWLGSAGAEAIGLTPLPGKADKKGISFGTFFAREQRIRSGANALAIPSTALFKPTLPFRKWLATDTLARRVMKAQP